MASFCYFIEQFKKVVFLKKNVFTAKIISNDFYTDENMYVWFFWLENETYNNTDL